MRIKDVGEEKERRGEARKLAVKKSSSGDTTAIDVPAPHLASADAKQLKTRW